MDKKKVVYTVPTRKQAKEQRDQEREGFWFPLDKTGGHARVRILSVVDRTSLRGLPAEMQQRVVNVFAEAARGMTRADTTDQWEENIAHLESLVNVVCIAAFIEPRLVETEAELDDNPTTMLVTDLHIDERMALYNIVMGTDAGHAEAKKLAPFRREAADRPVAPAPAGDGLRAAPVRLAGDAGVGLELVGADGAGPDGAGVRDFLRAGAYGHHGG